MMTLERPAAVAAATTVAVSLLAFAAFVALAGRRSSEYGALAAFTAPLALAVAWLGPRVARRAARLPAWVRPLPAALLGVLLAVAWTAIAALLLGGWIMAFDAPAPLCWALGAVAGALVAGPAAGLGGWAGAGVGAAVVGATVAQMYAASTAPPPRVALYVRPGASPAEVQRVWNEVLGRPGRRPGETRHLEGLGSIWAAGTDAGRAVLLVELDPGLDAATRETLKAQIAASPLVDRLADTTVTPPSRR